MVSVTEIHFNYLGKPAESKVLDIREGPEHGSAITSPEWRAGHPPKPVAYITGDVSEPPTILAKFNGPPDRAIKIRAVEGGLLGTAQAREPVLFDSTGQSALVELALEDHRFTDRCVRCHKPNWRWQCDLGSGWIDFQATNHRVLTVLGVPTSPWQQGSFDGGDNTQWPWVSALELACLWAMDASNEDTAAERITTALNASPKFSYDSNGHFLLSGDRFDLSGLLREIHSGRTIAVNCVDCANTVLALSNIVGCHFYSMPLTGVISRPVLLIGKKVWVQYTVDHEVGWVLSESDDPYVYDASLQVDVDANDHNDLHIARLPTKMRFSKFKHYLVGDSPVLAKPDLQPKRREVA